MLGCDRLDSDFLASWRKRGKMPSSKCITDQSARSTGVMPGADEHSSLITSLTKGGTFGRPKEKRARLILLSNAGDVRGVRCGMSFQRGW